MARVIHKSNRLLEIQAYPKCLVGVIGGFLAIFWFAVLNTDEVVTIDFYLIFHGVAFVAFAIQKHRVTRFDKQTQMVCIISKSIIGKNEQWYSLKDISSVEMAYGSGQYARGGSVNLVINNKLIMIVGSDVCFGNRERNIRLKDEVAEWL